MATMTNNAASLPQTIATAIGRGKSRKEVVKILGDSGINPQDAEMMVDFAIRNHKAEVRKGAMGQIGAGFVLLVIGIAITAATYQMASPGGTYIISFGPIIFGAIRILGGLWKLATA